MLDIGSFPIKKDDSFELWLSKIGFVCYQIWLILINIANTIQVREMKPIFGHSQVFHE